MERKHTPLYGIKGKLISAVCMLLVAVIMVVSSTYAWFTLSTAPEVSGISTAIGANGALDIRLNNGTYDPNGDVNATWGNLVNLSGTEYGFQDIVLLPAGLKFTSDGYIDPTFLGGSNYGPDGRPNGLTNGSQLGTYQGGKFVINSETGVRVVGASSGLSEMQRAWNAAKNAASTAVRQARNSAVTSLTSNGDVLANIVISVALYNGESKNAAPISAEELSALRKLVVDLDTTIGYIEDAYEQQILAFAASKTAQDKVGMEKHTAFYNAIEAGLNDQSITLEGIASSGKLTVTVESQEYEVSLDSATALTTGINTLVDTKEVVNNARTALNADGVADAEGNTTWGQVSVPVNSLINKDYVTVNNMTAEAIKADINVFVQNYKGTITVKLLGERDINGDDTISVDEKAGAGIYEQIADQCGDFSASITVDVKYSESMSFTDVPATMTVDGNSGPYTTASAEIVSADAMQPVKDTASGVAEITEFYGFIVDFSFQTNAANSDLLLQVDAKDRIYSDNDSSAETYGGGSYMTFSNIPDATSFTKAQIQELMKAVRIVFFAPAEGTTGVNEVLAYAKLDAANATVVDGGVKASMYLYKTVYEYTYTVAGDDPATSDDVETEYAVTVYATTEEHKAYTKYYTDKQCTAEATLPADVTPTRAKDGDLVKAAEEVVFEKEKAVITSLDQNVAKNVSTLVYFDGEEIENKDVASNGTKSVDIDMNIQFSSSATLTPMEYGEYHKPVTQDTGN